MIGAQRENEKIAVEIKSFSGLSDVDDFEDTLGQFLLYKLALVEREPDRVLFLAMPKDYYKSFFDDSFFVQVLKTYLVNLIVYDFRQIKIEQWIK